MKKALGRCAVLAIGILAASEGFAQANPNQLIAQRKGAMNLQAKYFSPMLRMARGQAPFDAKLAQRNAEYLAVLSQLPWDDFQQSTAGAQNTRAKEDVYKDPAKFKGAADKLHAEAEKLVVAARGGNQDAIKSATLDVARACNSCHESFATFEFRFPTQ